jgi:uncharacterized protein (DUF305 family)
MTTNAKRLAFASVVVGVSALMLSGVRAQDAGHKGHDAPGSTAATNAKGQGSADEGPRGKGGHMPMMHGKHKGHMGGSAMAPAKGDTGPSSQAFNAINTQMHHAMAIAFTGDTDVDFVKAMIPHHQGAVDMAKVVLGFGKDPAIRKLAESVVQAQEAEITQMNAWLKSKGQ